MIGEFKVLKSLFRVRGARTDSPIFRLHYSFTVAALAAATLLVSGIHWVGNPIHCAYNKQHFTQEYVESMCWVNGTYYNPEGQHRHGRLEAAPHIRPGRTGGQDHSTRYVMYYQWVSFCLFFQAMLFYFPRWAWKEMEDGTLDRLLDGNTNAVTYLCQNSKKNNRYMFCYYMAEIAALGNLVGQMFLLDRFFGGLFWSYGANVVRFAYDNFQGMNPMIAVFPRMTKCSAKSFAFNGNLDTIEALCILPLNVLNEKIYLFQWFWFLILFTLTCFLMMYRAAVFISPGLQLLLLTQRLSYVDTKLVARIFKKLSPGDWFMLYTMAAHMDIEPMSEIMYELDLRMNFGKKIFPDDDVCSITDEKPEDDGPLRHNKIPLMDDDDKDFAKKGIDGDGTGRKRPAPPVPAKNVANQQAAGGDQKTSSLAEGIRLRPFIGPNDTFA